MSHVCSRVSHGRRFQCCVAVRRFLHSSKLRSHGALCRSGTHVTCGANEAWFQPPPVPGDAKRSHFSASPETWSCSAVFSRHGMRTGVLRLPRDRDLLCDSRHNNPICALKFSPPTAPPDPSPSGQVSSPSAQSLPGSCTPWRKPGFLVLRPAPALPRRSCSVISPRFPGLHPGAPFPGPPSRLSQFPGPVASPPLPPCAHPGPTSSHRGQNGLPRRIDQISTFLRTKLFNSCVNLVCNLEDNCESGHLFTKAELLPEVAPRGPGTPLLFYASTFFRLSVQSRPSQGSPPGTPRTRPWTRPWASCVSMCLEE